MILDNILLIMVGNPLRMVIQVAKEVGCKPTSVMRNIRGSSPLPSIGLVAQLARALDCRSKGCGFEPRSDR